MSYKEFIWQSEKSFHQRGNMLSISLECTLCCRRLYLLSGEEYKSRLGQIWNKCILHMSVLDVSTGVKPWFDVIVLLQGRSDSGLTNDRMKPGSGVSQGWSWLAQKAWGSHFRRVILGCAGNVPPHERLRQRTKSRGCKDNNLLFSPVSHHPLHVLQIFLQVAIHLLSGTPLNHPNCIAVV